jgi:phage shock protein A
MSWFKQLKDEFDNLVSRLENSDALVLATIRDVEAQTQAAQADLTKLAELVKELDDEAEALSHQIQTWTTKAINLADTDEPTALQCVEFVNQLEHRRQQLLATRAHHKATQANLQRVITQLETAAVDLSSERQVRRNEAYLSKTNAAIARLQNTRADVPEPSQTTPIETDSGQLREQLTQMIRNAKSN